MKKELKKEELAELSGGKFELSGYEVKNLNTTSGCVCYFNNQTALVNENSKDGCSCVCQKR